MRNSPSWGEYVRQLRQVARISRPELARRLGVNPATVWRWETQGARPENPEIPQALAELFDIELEETLAAAGLRPGVGAPAQPTVEVDEEIELVQTDPNLTPEMKERVIRMIEERRKRERQVSIEETRHIINLLKRGA